MVRQIETLMRQKGITWYRLAKDTGISQNVFYNLRRRDGTLSFENAVKVAEYFGVPLLELIEK